MLRILSNLNETQSTSINSVTFCVLFRFHSFFCIFVKNICSVLLPTLFLRHLRQISRTKLSSPRIAKLNRGSMCANNPVKWISHLFKAVKQGHGAVQMGELVFLH